MEKNTRKNKGITLVALVITVIILLILAGVSISVLGGENGLIKRAEQAKLTSEESNAREKLSLILMELQQEKVINSKYNENEYLDNYLISKQIVVNGNIVIVDGWQFQIDRSVPKIEISLGKGSVNKQIILSTKITNESDYSKSKITIEVEYDKISSIQINGENIEIPEKQDGKYIVEKEVFNNGTYTILVKDSEDSYNMVSVEVTEISENLEIRTLKELVAFRDKVNNGTTYEGKTIKLMNDININENKYTVNADGSVTFNSDAQQWEPIGTVEKPFKGTFEGNNHSIKGIYINDTTKNTQGFIGENIGGTVKNLTVEEGYIVAGYRIGGITARTTSGTIENVINKMNIESQGMYEENNASVVGGISGSVYDTVIKDSTNYGEIIGEGMEVGGIAGYIENVNITNCANLSSLIETTGANSEGSSCVGGIVGYIKDSNVSNSRNTANIIGYKVYVGGIAGAVIDSGDITNCENSGSLVKNTTAKTNGYSHIGGIVGYTKGNISKCYNNADIEGAGAAAGGIVGYSEGTNITDCRNLSSSTKTTGATTTGYSFIGGIVGYSNANISTSYNISYVEGAKSSVGGIAGQVSGTVTQCYNKGSVKSVGTNDSGNNTVGGIAGYAGNTVSNCYNMGAVTGTAKIIGGIVGSNAETDVTVKQELKNCYNVGVVGPTTATNRGGIAGAGKSTSNCYYLTGTASYGVGGSTSTTGSNTNTGYRSEANLKALASTLGTAFTDDTNTINQGYPILTWQIGE